MSTIFTLTITCDSDEFMSAAGAASHGWRGLATARALDRVASKIRAEEYDGPIVIRDGNGNTIGAAEFKESV